ncbi:iron-containing alcohol dehydrogenase [Yersinia pekkanenii]|uniref:Glycerol dehydrogenase n=1 Tax=Yersinia pekkanenii TaxID=1288385 RepID=A0A0T9NVY0_9GAMM|nr:iron-containing alcohol dehydrogenase [Yersinia pekkanenii]CNH32422.1 glycerol dehydrogenase [Yersinia pekkanenii]CRY62996.1 glycerol dehydrogenase [Yersinia pekkanenii]
MLKVIQSPSKYIQGANALQSIGEFANSQANNYFIIADDFVMKLAADTVGSSLHASGLKNHFSRFNGECSRQEIERLTQLVLQNSSMEEIETLLSFCQQLGLPMTLAEMGGTPDIECKIRAVAKASCAEGETIHNMPFDVTPDSVYAAIIVADRLGQAFLN